MQQVKLSQCKANSIYGRPLDNQRVHEIVQGFDNRLVGALILCDVRRENLGYDYEFIDGNHRGEVLSTKYGKEHLITVEPLEYMPFKERSALFDKFNSATKSLKKIDKFRARLHAEYEEEVAIHSTCRKLGVSIKGIDPESYPAVGAMNELAMLYRSNCLERVLTILVEAYGNAPISFRERSFSRELLKGLRTFVRVYGESPDYKRLGEKLSEIRPKVLVAELIFQAGHDSVGGATLLVDIYNKRAKKNRLNKAELALST